MGSETALRWTARIWGVASALLLLAFAFGGREHVRFTADEAVAFLFFPVGVMIGFAVAWRWELAGGLVSVGSLVLFSLYMFAWRGRWPGPYFLLFAAPGFLHVAHAVIAARRVRRAAVATPAGSLGGSGRPNSEPVAASDRRGM